MLLIILQFISIWDH